MVPGVTGVDATAVGVCVWRIGKGKETILEENQSVKGPNVEKKSQRWGRRENE